MQKELYEKPDSVLVRSHSLTYISDVTVQVIINAQQNIQQFIPLVWKYTDLQELTPYVLNELIEKIVVHEKVIGPDGVKTQQVDIYYKFIGLISQKAEGGCSGEVTKAVRPREGRSA